MYQGDMLRRQRYLKSELNGFLKHRLQFLILDWHLRNEVTNVFVQNIKTDFLKKIIRQSENILDSF